LRKLLLGIWIASLSTIVFKAAAMVENQEKSLFSILKQAPFSQLQTRILNVVTLGYRPAYDDFMAIWAIQLMADPRLADEDAEEVFKSLEGVLRHLPRKEALYMSSCFILSLDLKRPDLCEKVTSYGLKAMPESWRIPVTQAFMYIYKLTDKKNAALFYSLAASKKGAPQFLSSLAKKLQEQTDLKVTELKQTLEYLNDVEGGSRFSEFLFERSKKDQ
jgi:hypothetical protein